MEDRGRHFILHLIKFIFEVTRRCPLPMDIKNKLKLYHPEQRSFFDGVVARALIITITDFMDRDSGLADIASPEFQDELMEIDKNEVFLKFVGRYSVKVYSEYSHNHLNSPMLFLEYVTDFLANLRINEGSVSDYIEKLKISSERIVNEDKKRQYELSRCPVVSVVDMSKQKCFIVDVMNCVFDVFNAPESVKLKSESSQSLLTPHIKNVLSLIVKHHKRFLLIWDYDVLKDYFHNRCVKAFDEKDFLELCVCCVGTITHNHTDELSLESSENVCDFLLEILERGILQNKFTFAGIHEAAHDLHATFKKFYQNI